MNQSILHPAGPMAERILGLWDLMYWICAAVFVLVILALLAAVLRRRAKITDEEDLPGPPPPDTHRRLVKVIGAATAVTVVLLFVLLTGSVATGRATATLPGEPLNLKLTGKQWWWQVEYVDPVPSQSITTANEIHIPVGRPVKIQLESTDVIHSFWVPNLHGKKDLIPGYSNVIWIEADRPGVYRGQCAEFCGFQHAHMALLVIADPPERFRAWADAQRQSSAPPRTPQQALGKYLVERLPCANCHTVRGTQASGRLGPDLTHLASRRTLAAGTMPNNRGHLSGWLLDPQSVKPGSLMPPTAMSSESLQAVLAYLETLR
ncbi:MAG: cytochrome c oxidase subunit [Acidobacteriota bacterium]|jgi:cytochrome c oxidase subunit 2|nr:cytochrome c oxidase subunit [Acidobacteriota bacterium]